MADTLLDSCQLGRRIGVSPETIRSWAREGRIPCIRITPKVIRFDWEAVLAALDVHEQAAARTRRSQ